MSTVDRDTSSHESSGKESRVFSYALIAVAVIMLYILSIGPAVMAFARYHWSREALQIIYAPVIMLHDHTPLKEPLEWYVGLFE